MPDGATEFKCCPPIRDAANRDLLWQGLADGVIGCVVSDHSPCTPELKKGGFDTAWGGISSLQLGLPVIWTAARERGHGLADVVRWMASGPAELAGLPARAASRAAVDADLVAFAPDASFVVDPAALRQRHPVTPYAGRELTGVVEDVWLARRARRARAGCAERLLRTRGQDEFHRAARPRPAHPRRLRHGRLGRVVRGEGEPHQPRAPAFEAHTFGPKGQTYDGWETGRRRTPGHDWAIVRLGLPGVIRGVVVDTAWFKGNYPPHATVEACSMEGYPSADELTGWTEIVPRSPLKGDAANEFEVSDGRRFTHVRLNIHPDGGVARLRVHGDVVPDPALLSGLTVDLAALENGGTVTGCSNMFYSSPSNVIMPGLARHQAEGWETARRRDEGNDWITLRLAGPGVVRLAEIDTSNLKFNAPARGEHPRRRRAYVLTRRR